MKVSLVQPGVTQTHFHTHRAIPARFGEHQQFEAGQRGQSTAPLGYTEGSPEQVNCGLASAGSELTPGGSLPCSA
jgi:hypothetical protein